jgi:hypothetical protein
LRAAAPGQRRQGRERRTGTAEMIDQFPERARTRYYGANATSRPVDRTLCR